VLADRSKISEESDGKWQFIVDLPMKNGDLVGFNGIY
jgi:hypothetical protein